MNSPIRYFGSKGMFQKEILNRFPNSETYDTYLEPYGGGASVLFAIEDIKPIEIYNDIEENVYSFMKVLQKKELFEEFKTLCDLSYHSRQLNDEFKEKLKLKNIPIVERAYMFYYNTRTSFNGLGGYTCHYAVRRGMSKGISDYLSGIDKLLEYHQRLSRVQIENLDALQLLKKHNTQNVFAYLDPPYTIENQNNNNSYYKNFFSVDHQEQLVDYILTIKSKILLSGYKNNIYDKLENSGWKRIDFIVNTIKNKKSYNKTESLWMNY